MMKLFGYIYYRFFSDGRKSALLALLFCLNLASMYLVLRTVPEIEPGEIFGKNDANNRQNITDTVSSAEEFYDNILFMYDAAEHDLERAQGLFADYDHTILSIYGRLLESIEIPDDNFTSSRFFSYHFDAAFIAAAVVLFAVTIYTEDSALGLPLLIRTTRNGRHCLNTVKQTTVLVFTFACTSVFILSELLVFGGNLPFYAPVQTLPGMALCPYLINIAQYLAVTYLMKSLAVALYIFICLFIIQFSGNVIFCCGFSVAIGSLSVAASLVSPTSIFNVSNYIGIYRLFCVSPLFSRYVAVAFGNRLYPAALIVCAAALIFLATLFTAEIFISPASIIRNQTVSKKKLVPVPTADNYPVNIKIKSDPRVISRTLYVHELYKCVYSTGAWIILLVAIIMSVYSSISSQISELSANELIYLEYIAYYSGDTVEESLHTNLKSEDISITASVLEKKKELWYNAGNNFTAGKITLEEYEEILTECGDAVIRQDAFRRVETYNRYLSKRQDVSFIYDTGWNAVFSRGIDLPVYIAALLLSVGIFMIECDKSTSACGFDVILRTTIRGRKETLKNKLYVLALCCLILSAISESVSTLSIITDYPLPLLRASADSLMIFAEAPHRITIGEMFIMNEFSRIFSLMSFSFVFAGISYIIKNRLTAVICGVSILLLFRLIVADTVMITSLYCYILILAALVIAAVSVGITYRKWL